MRKLTVTIFTYNRAISLKKCIECILNSTYSDFFLVILDNASTDNTRDIVETFNDDRILYINNGVNIFRDSIKKAFRLCDTKYFYPMCDDDYIEPSEIHKIMNVFEKYPEMNLVTTNYVEIDTEGNLIDGGYKGNSVLVDTYYNKFDYLLQDKFARFSTTIFDMEFIKEKKVKLNERNHDALFMECLSLAGAYIYRLSEPLVNVTYSLSVQHMKDILEREEFIVCINTTNFMHFQLQNIMDEKATKYKKDIIIRKLEGRFLTYYENLIELDFYHPELMLADEKLRKNMSWISYGKIQDERMAVYFKVFDILADTYSSDEIKLSDFYHTWDSIMKSANITKNLAQYKNIAIWGVKFNSKLLYKYFHKLGIKVRYTFDNRVQEKAKMDNCKTVKPTENIIQDIDLIVLGNEGINSISNIIQGLIEMNYKGEIMSWKSLI